MRGRWRTTGERRDRLAFRPANVKYSDQIRGCKNLQQEWGELAKLEVSPRGAKGSQRTDQGAQAAAIEKSNALQLQDEFLRFQKVFFYLKAQGLRLFAEDNAAFTADNHNIADFLALTNELH